MYLIVGLQRERRSSPLIKSSFTVWTHQPPLPEMLNLRWKGSGLTAQGTDTQKGADNAHVAVKLAGQVGSHRWSQHEDGIGLC